MRCRPAFSIRHPFSPRESCPMTVIPAYGVAINNALASGDLSKLKEALVAAEKHIEKYGDIPALIKSTRGKSPGKLNTLTCMADSQWVAGYAGRLKTI